mgnify:CR=1 FL=1
MLDFKFLNREQLFSDEKLSIIEKRGTKAALTDFAIILGAFVSDDYYLDNSNEDLKDRAGCYWTYSDDKDDNAYVVDCGGWLRGGYDYVCVNNRTVAARPVLSFSTIYNIPISGVAIKAEDKILEVEYGYYPQYAVNEYMQQELERIYKTGKLLKTDNTFTIDSRKNGDDNCFLPKTIDEYKYKDKRYVRVITNSESGVKLSNLRHYPNGAAVWVEVQPIKWLIDEEEKIMISDKLLFAGVQFKNEIDYKGDFNSTDIKWFMNTFFSKELVQSISEKKKDNVELQDENSSISNFDINLETALRIILSAKENNQKIELHTFDKEEKQKVYTIK